MTTNPLTASRVERVLQLLPVLVDGLDVAGTRLTGALDADLSVVVADYCRIMEIAHYLRRGGVKAMIYRLETGRTKFMPDDCFDQASMRLGAAYLQLSSCSADEGALLERLKAVGEEGERAVKEILPRIDALLLVPNRREAVSVDEGA